VKVVPVQGHIGLRTLTYSGVPDWSMLYVRMLEVLNTEYV